MEVLESGETNLFEAEQLARVTGKGSGLRPVEREEPAQSLSPPTCKLKLQGAASGRGSMNCPAL
jgi:hypothetical protein